MSFLDTILSDTRAEVARRRARTPLAALEARTAFSAPTLSLAEALRRPTPAGVAAIAECKAASPSKGVLRREYDPAAIARGYKRGGAAAVSVLTEPFHFRGALAHLAAVRQAVDLPLLRKDFVVDEYQLTEARAYGADAVLLIAAALEPALLRDLHAAAEALGLEALVEVHDARELDGLDLDCVRIVGVNHRDLRTFTTDLARSEPVFRALPEGVVRVAESGLSTADDLARVRAYGAGAVLVGEALVREEEPGCALRQLLAQTAAARPALAA